MLAINSEVSRICGFRLFFFFDKKWLLIRKSSGKASVSFDIFTGESMSLTGTMLVVWVLKDDMMNKVHGCTYLPEGFKQWKRAEVRLFFLTYGTV